MHQEIQKILYGDLEHMWNKNFIFFCVLLWGGWGLSCSTESPPNPDRGIYRMEIKKEGPCEEFHFFSSVSAAGGFVYTDYDQSGKSPYTLSEEENKAEHNSFYTSVNATNMSFECSALNIHGGVRDSLVIQIFGYFNGKIVSQMRHVYYSYTPDEIRAMEYPGLEVNTIFRTDLRSFIND